MVHVINENSTRAPKMHIAAAPASRNDPGRSSHAEYQGGWITSPRSEIRPAPKTSPAVTTAGAVRPTAHRIPTEPETAPTMGCTPAIARPAATENATNLRITLGCGMLLKAHSTGAGAAWVKTGCVATQPYCTSR